MNAASAKVFHPNAVIPIQATDRLIRCLATFFEPPTYRTQKNAPDDLRRQHELQSSRNGLLFAPRNVHRADLAGSGKEGMPLRRTIRTLFHKVALSRKCMF